MSKSILCSAIGAFVLSGLSTGAEASVIISSDFVSTGSNQNLNGTQVGLATNTPGGNWVFGAGWNWSQPTLGATWSGAANQNLVNLNEEEVALGLPIGSNGGYTKPTQINVSADLTMFEPRTQVVGVGFWSAMPARDDAAHSLNNYTGLILNDATDTLRVYTGGAYTGAAVGVGVDVVEDTTYTLSYTVDTVTGDISDVLFNGSPIAGLSTTAFTDTNTAFVGVLSGSASRLRFDNFVVQAVPEPAMLGLAGLLLTGLKRRR